MFKKVCSKCGGSGPFPPRGRVCRKCKAEYQSQYAKEHPHQYDPERDKAKARRWREKHSERVHEIARQSERKRQDTGKIAVYKESRRAILNEQAREGYQRRMANPEYRKAYNARMRAYNQKKRKVKIMDEELRPLPPDEEDLEWDRDCAYRLALDGVITQEQLDIGEIRTDLQEAVQQGLADQQK